MTLITQRLYALDIWELFLFYFLSPCGLKLAWFLILQHFTFLYFYLRWCRTLTVLYWLLLIRIWWISSFKWLSLRNGRSHVFWCLFSSYGVCVMAGCIREWWHRGVNYWDVYVLLLSSWSSYFAIHIRRFQYRILKRCHICSLHWILTSLFKVLVRIQHQALILKDVFISILLVKFCSHQIIIA